MRATGFAPVARADASILILGSLPGAMSLARRQYYALPQNGFWRIMSEIVAPGLSCKDLSYEKRLECLMERRIALWDVCKAASREGSLDSAIDRATVECNDFAGFFKTHPHIGLICFNGGKAADLYKRLVQPYLPAAKQAIPAVRLPSTSPAHAARSFEQKRAVWRKHLLPEE